MRKESEDYDWHVYGLKVTDFDFTLGTIDDIIFARASKLRDELVNVIVTDEKGTPVEKTHDGFQEVISDIAYYHWCEDLFIYQFALWRLQGIFEGIIRQEFLPEAESLGIKGKMDRLIELGYKIDLNDRDELMKWARLRNALSHFPPEEFRPSDLSRTDLAEYTELASRVICSLIAQKNHEES
jgi:hypothetical protein